MSEISTDTDRYSSMSMSRMDSFQGTLTGSSTPKSYLSDDDWAGVVGGSPIWDDPDALSDSRSVRDSREFDMGVVKGELKMKGDIFGHHYGARNQHHHLSTDAANDDIVGPVPVMQAPVEEKKLTPEEIEAKLNEPYTLSLTETETFFIIDLYDESVALDDPAADSVKLKNEAYKKLLANRKGNDKYVDRAAQTFSNAKKNKYVQFKPAEMVESGVEVTGWLIYDEYLKIQEQEEREADEKENVMISKLQTDAATGADDGNSGDDLIDDETETWLDENEIDDDSGSVNGDKQGAGHAAGGADMASQHSGGSGQPGDPRLRSIARLPSFVESLMNMERVLVQNIDYKLQVEYKTFDAEIDIKPSDITIAPATRAEDVVEYEERPATQPDGAPEAANEEKPTESDKRDNVIEGETRASMENAAPQPSARRMKNHGDSISTGGRRLKSLWTYSCNITNNQKVQAMAWNRKNNDLLAVGYSNFSFIGPKSGTVLCWSIKNTRFPERVIRIPNVGVSALDFSSVNPNILAVGFDDGSMSLYDIRKRGSHPILESGSTDFKHTSTVWDLQWVDRGRDNGEKLTSVSGDGRISQWAIKKGLDCQDIMKLKRVSGRIHPTSMPTVVGPNRAGAGAAGGKAAALAAASTTAAGMGFSPMKGVAFISQTSGGMSIDFDPNDPTMYLVGTEDGIIHRCSTSYSEQELDTYYGHNGPVYRVRYNPFDSNIFISCSSDWTVRVWNQEKDTPLLTFESYSTSADLASAINDVAWSYNSSTMFGSVSAKGVIDIWDMSVSSLNPLVSETRQGRNLSSILFAKESPAVLVGDDKGCVEVLKLCGIAQSTLEPEDQKAHLERAVSDVGKK
eukprot:GEZU01026048.1.p1 GENE.GEZU01026048.1~~GEZU01026048.1.p1  ORF type:complete len:927 (+),score=251.84 GEZU01026048.1:225-2783(+)